MKIYRIFVIFVLGLLLSGCRHIEDQLITFDTSITCNESAVDFVEKEASAFPSGVEKGYIYSYVFDFGQFSFVFHNPDAEREIDKIITVLAYGNQFHNGDGVFLKTEIPEGYYLDEVSYKYGAMCRDSADEETISNNLSKSFVYYSETEYTESEFKIEYSELFD